MPQLTEGIPIPVSCPKCDSGMFRVGYDAPLKILKERSWQICKECGFERSTEDFKRSLLTV
ncbi:MAG: hypothetical protein O6761_04420 [Thaumarchaeota archaeon]|nr:hypothetical protein [Nitrososphaerota archaeon]